MTYGWAITRPNGRFRTMEELIADQDFTCAAREAMPALIAEVRRLRREAVPAEPAERRV